MKFIKEHKILSLLFAISILLMIKNSKIPYPFDPPAFVSFVFDSPKGEFFSGVMQMVDIFASAYVTSLVFYFMVDYIPALKEAKKAKEIISPKLVNLYLYIGELLAMIEFAAKKEKIFQTGNIDDMDKLHFKDKIIICKQKKYKNEAENGSTPYSYNLLKDCNNFRTAIMNTCSEISCTPSFSYCDKQVIHIISEIQLSELLRILPKPNDFLLKFDFADILYMGLGKGYEQLVSIHKKLADLVDTRLSCQMLDISNDEIDEWQKKSSRIITKIPRTCTSAY